MRSQRSLVEGPSNRMKVIGQNMYIKRLNEIMCHLSLSRINSIQFLALQIGFKGSSTPLIYNFSRMAKSHPIKHNISK